MTNECVMKKEKVYIIVDERCVDDVGDIEIIGTYKDLEKAKEVLKERVKSSVGFNRYFSIGVNTDTAFVTYLDEDYSNNHISITIRESTLE